MGNINSYERTVQKINFEDVQFVLKNREGGILINTLPFNEQKCLLPNTVNIEQEEQIINNLLQHGKKECRIVIYGKNSSDETVYKQAQKLQTLGFYNIYVYAGGLFEWLMLQDIYSDDNFPTTESELDFLKFRPKRALGIPLLDY